MNAFRRLYAELREDDDPQAWNGLVDATADAGLNELEPELRAAYEKGLPEWGSGDLQYMLGKLLGPREEVIERFKYHRHLVTSAVDAMSWWACFHKDDPPRPKIKQGGLPKHMPMPGFFTAPANFSPKKAQEPQLIQRVVKTGRNDPCPCGSGKKYKKCCLR